MIIKKINLYNIRSYVEEEIKFDRGIALFEGDIGSGKTTLLMAIDFALFGNSTRKFYERLLRKGASKGYVKIVFEHNSQEYMIYRELEKKGSSIINTESYVITPQGKLKLTASDVRNYVLKLLGVNSGKGRKKTLPVVKYAIYTPQETMKEILEGSDDERLEVIRKVFKLDEYKIAGENAKKVSRTLSAYLEIAKSMKEEVDRLKKEIDEKNEQLEDIENSLKKLMQEFSNLAKEYENKSLEWKEIQNKRKVYEYLKSEIASINVEIRALKENIERDKNELEDIEKMKNKFKALEEKALKYEEMEEKREKLQEELNILRKVEVQYKASLERIKLLEEKVSKLNEKSDEFENLLKEEKELEKEVSKLKELENTKAIFEETGNEIRSKIKFFTEKRENILQEIDEIKSLGGICPKCKRPLSEDHKRKLVAELEENIKLLKEKIVVYNKKYVEIKKKLMEIDREVGNIRELNKKLVRIEEKIATLSREIKDLKSMKKELQKERESLPKFDENRINVLVEELKVLKKDVENYRSAWREYNTLKRELERENTIKNRILTYMEDLKKLEEQLNTKTEKLDLLNYSENLYQKIDEEHRKMGERLSSLRAMIDDRKGRIRDLDREIENKRKLIEKLNKTIRLYRRRGEFGEWLKNEFRPVLEEIEKMRLLAINEEFRMLFEEWFHEILGESEYEATVDEMFRPIVRYERFDMPLDSLSGGERTSIALAYRLALNAMVKKSLGLNSNLLILDEPTDGFSKDQLYKLKDVFEKMDTDQVIIVSHEKELMNLADVVYHVEKVGGISEIKRLSG